MVKNETTEALDVQLHPLATVTGAFQVTGQIKVDAAYRIDRFVLVAGWRTNPCALQISCEGLPLKIRELNVERPDVAQHFDLSDGKNLGFVLVAEYTGTGPLSLVWIGPDQQPITSAPLAFESTFLGKNVNSALLGSALGLIAMAFELNSPQWRFLVTAALSNKGPCPVAKGHIELLGANRNTKVAAVVGWLIQSAGTVVWLEDENGHCHSLDGAFRRYRQDVHEALGHNFSIGIQESGFLMPLQDVPIGSLLQLKVVSEHGVHLLSEIRCGEIPSDPVAAARWMFAINTPASEMHRRIPIFDEPLLCTLRERHLEAWDDIPVHVTQLGKSLDTPLVSIIIPLYGQSDLVEHQFIEFIKDAWLMQHAEIVYVLDDPRLVEPFTVQAQILFRLYKLSFKWVWGGIHRGFSGANNLGAHVSSGKYLAFLNSDTFPLQTGWLTPLLDVLETRSDIGAVGPRLLFPDGSIQHAGIEFQRCEELGVWIKYSPHIGHDPSLDRHQTLAIVSCISGACMLVRRSDFEHVGQWDTGYLAVDFEDSDLCHKLRANGMKIAYLPTVRLTHLERQSFKLLGQNEYRSKVVIYNALRHQKRWHELLQAPALTC